MKKIMILILIMTLYITSFPELETIVHAVENSKNLYEKDGIQVEFKINSIWETGFDGQFILTNNSTKPLENWRIQFCFNHEISSLWDGEIESHNGNEYVVKHPSWNPTIAAGGKVVVGLSGKCNGTVEMPFDFTIATGTVETPEEDYSITYKTTSDWVDAFNGEITITNHTKKSMENWKLEFDFEKEITQLWTGKIIEQNKNHYIITHDNWNSVIKPESSIKLGFEAKSGNSTEVPENFRLTHSELTNEKDDIPEDEGEFTEEELKIDTDTDAIPDCIEIYIGTNPELADTDGDGLSDYYEFTSSETDPRLPDTDDNGITDDKEDTDGDGLNNLKEFQLNTIACYADTDEDNLNDKDELEIYHTNPLNPDTDEDELLDGEEILLKLDPLKSDTDGNGILDGKEKIQQEVKLEISQPELPNIISSQISYKVAGDIKETIDFRNVYQGDIFASEVVGIKGIPVRIHSVSPVESAKITFGYKETMTNKEIDNLGILYREQDNGTYTILNSQVDKTNHTISAAIPNNLGVCLVVDKRHWYAAWKQELNYGNKKLEVSGCDIVFAIDNSESMTDKRLEKAKTALSNFISTMGSKDRGSLVSFTAYHSTLVQKLSMGKTNLKKAINNLKVDKSTLKNVKPDPTINEGLEKAITHLTENKTSNARAVVLLVDGEMRYSKDIVDMAKANNINIFVINIGKENENRNLKKMIWGAEGYYYDAAESENILNSLLDIRKIYHTGVDMKDTDGDGLFDIYEKIGMQLNNGQVEKLDPKNADMDEDGLSDYEEMNASRILFTEIESQEEDSPVGRAVKKIKRWTKWSEKKARKADTDGDGIRDRSDPCPWDFNVNDIAIEKIDQLDKLAIQYCKKKNKGKNEHKWYTFMFIRNLGTTYHTENWDFIAGIVDKEFIIYVETINPELYNYFVKTKNIRADEYGNKLDLYHFGGAMSISLYETTVFKSVKLSALAPEVRFNDMGGWAGDLQQVVSQTMSNYKNGSNLYTEIYQKINQKGGKYFSDNDYSADLDVVHLYKLIKGKRSIKESMRLYYSKEGAYQFRTSYFVKTLLNRGAFSKDIGKMTKEEQLEKLEKEILIYTKLKYMHNVWPLYERWDDYTKRKNKQRKLLSDILTQNHSELASTAFAMYLYEHIEHYISTPTIKIVS